MADKGDDEKSDVTTDFDVLDADLAVDMSEFEEGPNPMDRASEDQLARYREALGDVVAARQRRVDTDET